MTAISAPAIPAPALAARIGTTIRIHLANPWSLVITPALITFGVFLLNFAIWHAVRIAAGDRPLDPNAFNYNGGVSWVLFFMTVVAVQSMNQTFSFTVGLGATRRDYFLGTTLLFAGLALGFGTWIALMAGIERATNGWGINGHFFAPGFLGSLPLWELAVVYSLAIALMLAIGSAAGAMFVRWAANGVIAFFAVLAVVVVGGVFAISATHSWEAVARFFSERDVIDIALLSIPITLASAGFAFIALRRATPKG